MDERGYRLSSELCSMSAVDADKLIECGGNLATAKEKGLVRSEGKDYVVKDGDVMHFLFNV